VKTETYRTKYSVNTCRPVQVGWDLTAKQNTSRGLKKDVGGSRWTRVVCHSLR